MIGPELAQILAPFAKWGAIVTGALAGVLFLIWLVRWWIGQAKEDEIEREHLEDAEKDRADFKDRLRKTRRRFRGAARRGWLRHSQRRDDPAA